MCAMLLADLGATILRIDRPQPIEQGNKRPLKYDFRLRNRSSVALDLKNPAAVQLVLRLIKNADALMEGFRPGVMERLGLGPEICFEQNARLVYGRMTGWGQDGPLAKSPGHDITYIAITGALDAIGRHGQPPTPPLNLVGDYAGGALYLALGLLAGILEARQSGRGQVIDAAIVDGAASLMTSLYGLHAAGMMTLERGTNLTDSGAYFYDVYQCADQRWIAIGPIESKFHAALLKALDLRPEDLGNPKDRANWPKAKAMLAQRFNTRARDEWCALLEGTDACVAPVLNMAEAPQHKHIQARKTFIEVGGIVQPAPAPRFSRTIPEPPTPPQEIRPENTDAALAPWISQDELATLRSAGVLH